MRRLMKDLFTFCWSHTQLKRSRMPQYICSECNDTICSKILTTAQYSSNAGNNAQNEGDNQLGSKASRKRSSCAPVPGPHRTNKVGEIK